MRISRRLFVVPVANNNHGKTTILNALLSQGLGAPSPARKGVRKLASPSGRPIDALVFPRSYQETEKKKYRKVVSALDGNDPDWRTRELIVLPSHVARSGGDIKQMIVAGHSAGFDMICASVLFEGHGNPRQFPTIWDKHWDERWTIPNEYRNINNATQLDAQLRALGCDLWVRICQTLAC